MVLSVFFASIFCVFGVEVEDNILQDIIKISEKNYCDNIELIADSAWEICNHDRKGFTWKDVEMCEVNYLECMLNEHIEIILLKEKTVEFCENFSAAGKKYGFECPGFKLPSRKDFDQIGITLIGFTRSSLIKY